MPEAPRSRPSRWRLPRPSGPSIAVGAALYAIFIVSLLAGGADDLALGTGHWVALLAAALVGAWSVGTLAELNALRYAKPASSERLPRLGLAKSAVVLVVVCVAASSAWEFADPPPDLFGLTDRILLAPVAVALVVWFCRGMRIRTWMAAVTVLVVLAAVFREAPAGDWPTELVAAAGPTDLAASRRHEEPIGMLSTRHDRGAGVALPPRRDGMRCQRIIARDQRRTLVGAAGRRVEITAEACWLRNGTPFSVQVVASGVARDARAEPYATQIVGNDPLDAAIVGEPVAPARIPPPVSSGTSGAGRVHAFLPDGRVRLPGEDGPVTLRVSRNGRVIDLVTGWLAIDPLVVATRDDGAPASVTGPQQRGVRVVVVGQRPQRNEVLDVFRVRFAYAGGPDATLVRVRPRGREPLALLGDDPGFVERGPLELETVRLTGGT